MSNYGTVGFSFKHIILKDSSRTNAQTLSYDIRDWR